MDRVSGWYKRRAQSVIATLAVLAAVGMNVDAVLIFKHLQTYPCARDALVAQASKFVASEQPPAGAGRRQDVAARRRASTAATIIMDIDVCRSRRRGRRRGLEQRPSGRHRPTGKSPRKKGTRKSRSTLPRHFRRSGRPQRSPPKARPAAAPKSTSGKVCRPSSRRFRRN